VAIGRNAQATDNFAVAIGSSAQSTEFYSIAVGEAARSFSGGATAIGRNANIGTASNDSVAVGTNATINNNSRYSIAIGQGARVTPAAGGPGVIQDAISIGTDAVSGGSGSSAIGLNATANFDRSTAIGENAVATRTGQMVFGNATNTYTAAGITSGASAAAQTSGPIEIVTTDQDGNLASDGGFVFDQLSDQADDIDTNSEGVAMALAMQAPFVPVDGRVGLTGNWGTFEGENAFAFGAALRLNEHAQFDAGVGVGINQGAVGGRAGLLLHW